MDHSIKHLWLFKQGQKASIGVVFKDELQELVTESKLGFPCDGT